MPKKPPKKTKPALTTETLREMIEVATKAQNRAYAPYSNYHVGAAILSEDGSIFGGCNFENASFGATICAERTAIGSMIAAGQRKPQAVVVVSSSPKAAAPCGLCRQVLIEFGSPEMKVYLFSVKEAKNPSLKPQEVIRLKDLVPFGFDISFLSSFKG